MGNRVKVFNNKYNILDTLCREKYKMFRDKNGKRESKSAIYEFCKTLPEAQAEKLRNIIKLRNIVIHTGGAEPTEQTIRDLDTFIAIVRNGGTKNKTIDDFNLISYISHNEKRMIFEINEIVEDSELSHSDTMKIKADLNDYIDKLKKAKTLEKAKSILRDFYSYIDNIDEHPLVIKQSLKEAREEAISELIDSYNSVMAERKNPFIRRKAKEIFDRYSNFINTSKNEDDIDGYAEDGCYELDELL